MGHLQNPTRRSATTTLSDQQETVKARRTIMGDETRRMGTQQEIAQLSRACEKRSTLRQELGRRSRELRRQRTHIQTQQILQAWKQEERYTRNITRKIRYARRPIVDIATRKRSKRRTQTQTYHIRNTIREYVGWVNGGPFRQEPIHIRYGARRTAQIANYIYDGRGKKAILAKYKLTGTINIIQENDKLGKVKKAKKPADYKMQHGGTIRSESGATRACYALLLEQETYT